MKWYWTPLLLVFALANAKAQFSIDSFDIATYARPDLERRTAFVDPFFGIRNRFNKFAITNNDGVQNNLTANLNGRLMTTKFVNTAANQTFVNNLVDIDNNFFGEKEESDNLLSQNSQLELNYLLRRTYNRKKFRANEKFLELNYTISTRQIYGLVTEQGSNEKTSAYGYSMGLNLGFYLGKGRIELVNDAWHAVTILEFLQADDLLHKSMSKDEIQFFAERISEIKNFRNTDSRLETIAEYQALAEYLVENEIVDSKDYRFFAVALDAWQFESFVNRRSGKEFKYGIKPLVNVFDLEQFSDGFSSSPFYSLLADIQYNNYNPISKEWQFDHLSSLSFGPRGLIRRTQNNSSIQPELSLAISSSTMLQYLPNQRTNYMLSLSANYGLNILPNIKSPFHLHSIGISLEGEYNYYLNPRLAWTIHGRLNLNSSRAVNYDFSSFGNHNQLMTSLSYRFR